MRVDKRFIVGVGQTNGIASLDGSGTVPLAQIPNVSSSARTINAQTGTTYTFALTDGSGNRNSPLVTLTNAASITATVPPNSSVAFPVGTQIDVIRGGVGEVVFAPGSGVTINAPDGASSIRRQYSKVSLIKTATDTWDLCGDLLIPEFIIATGGTITTDGNYKIHTFTSSGTFQITSGSGDVESLVIGGGGGGGGAVGGGGGAGELTHTTPGSTYFVGSYTVTVGAGGAGGGVGVVGTNGSSSVFDTITAIGGGGGGRYDAVAGLSGGSGGGGGGSGGAGAAGGASTASSGVGFAGGTGVSGNGSNAPCGGGGGAGGAGGTAAGSVAGNGGIGVSNSISGAAVTYASGGGGGSSAGTQGSASAGGGGAGGETGGTAGTANTGGGGGGAGGTGSGGAGGSGVVIVRYLYQ